MKAQAGISAQNLGKYAGQSLCVLLTGPSQDKDHPWEGRSMFQAPDIDGKVFVAGDNLAPGARVMVTITGAGVYDLYGKALS